MTDAGLARFAAALKPGAWPPAEWDLRALALAALYFSPDLAMARADRSVARAEVLAAGGRPNPRLDVDVAALTSGGTASPSILSLVLDIPFVTGGKRGLRIAQARSREESARWSVSTAAWAVLGRVRKAALDLWSAQAAEGLARQAVSDRSEQVSLMERRLAVGEASSLDLTRERVALDQARGTLGAAGSESAAARVELAAAVGVPVEALDSVRLELDDFSAPLAPPPDRSEARGAALLSRSDIRAALADYAAAQAALQLEVARQYPDITLAPGLHWEPELRGLTITPALDLPILNRNRGPIAVAEAQREAASARFLALQAGVLARVDDALARYAAGRGALTDADSAAARQTRLSEAVAAEYRAGEVDRLARVEADVERVAAEQERLAARIRALQALGDLEGALQRPLPGGPGPLPITEPESPGGRRFR